MCLLVIFGVSFDLLNLRQHWLCRTTSSLHWSRLTMWRQHHPTSICGVSFVGRWHGCSLNLRWEAQLYAIWGLMTYLLRSFKEGNLIDNHSFIIVLSEFDVLFGIIIVYSLWIESLVHHNSRLRLMSGVSHAIKHLELQAFLSSWSETWVVRKERWK